MHARLVVTMSRVVKFSLTKQGQTVSIYRLIQNAVGSNLWL